MPAPLKLRYAAMIGQCFPGFEFPVELADDIIANGAKNNVRQEDRENALDVYRSCLTAGAVSVAWQKNAARICVKLKRYDQLVEILKGVDPAEMEASMYADGVIAAVASDDSGFAWECVGNMLAKDCQEDLVRNAFDRIHQRWGQDCFDHMIQLLEQAEKPAPRLWESMLTFALEVMNRHDVAFALFSRMTGSSGYLPSTEQAER